MREADWDDIYPRLRLISVRLTKSYIWAGLKNGNIPCGFEEIDFASNAILKTMDGIRHWDPKSKPLINHLIDVMRSDISNTATNQENYRVRKFRDSIEGGTNNPYYALIEILVDASVKEEAENKIFIKQIVNFIAAEHPDLSPLVDAIVGAGLVNNQEIAVHLNCSAADIRNQRKRLKRALEKHGFSLSSSNLRGVL